MATTLLGKVMARRHVCISRRRSRRWRPSRFGQEFVRRAISRADKEFGRRRDGVGRERTSDNDTLGFREAQHRALLSVMYALYCLVTLFHAVKSDLHHPVNWHPVGKFLCVKGVIFFTFWQDVTINFLRLHGFIGDVGNWSGDDVAGGIIDYLASRWYFSRSAICSRSRTRSTSRRGWGGSRVAISDQACLVGSSMALTSDNDGGSGGVGI